MRHDENQRKVIILIGIFVYALISTLLLGGQFYQVFFAEDQMWTGVLSLLSILALAWLISPRINQRALRYFFWCMVIIAIVSLLSAIPGIAAGQRLAGIVLQPNILAIMLGSGFIAGVYGKDNGQPQFRLGGLAILLVAILLTQTRGVVILLPIVLIPFLLQLPLKVRKYAWLGLAAGVLGIFLCVPRIASSARFVYGATYRYDLAAYGIKNMAIMPPWGFGPDALTTVSGTYYPLPESLRATTLVDQKLLESSHVIVIDRFLEYGWLGGASYLLLISLFIIQGIRKRHDSLLVVVFAIGCFVLVQQLLTVARFQTEIILWVAMLTVIGKRSTDAKVETSNG